MQKCSICSGRGRELYPVDDHLVCELCFAQGRLEELPDIANAGRRELELVAAGITLSSWWNRDVPDELAPLS
jgi:hypothetical protein